VREGRSTQTNVHTDNRGSHRHRLAAAADASSSSSEKPRALTLQPRIQRRRR